MTIRGLYPYGTSLTRPVTMELRNRFENVGVARREAPLAPLKGLAAVAIYGVQMLNAELELAARTG